MTDELKNDLVNILRARNHELIEDNTTLYMRMYDLESVNKEQTRYIAYLETILNELGWNPNTSHSC